MKANWKFTSMEMPETMKNVLFFTKQGNIHKGFFGGANWVIQNSDSLISKILKNSDDAVAWTNLPDKDDEDWITDKTPKIAERVLINDDGEVKIADIVGNHTWIVRNSPDDYIIFHASTHCPWMPMPDAPCDKKKADRCDKCDFWIDENENNYGECTCEEAPEYGVKTMGVHKCCLKQHNNNNHKVGDLIWWFDAYDTLRWGRIYDIKDTYAAIFESNIISEKTGAKLCDCYTSKEECIKARKHKSELQIAEYKESIKNVNDLVKFLYRHDVHSENRDAEAQVAVKERVKELLGLELD